MEDCKNTYLRCGTTVDSHLCAANDICRRTVVKPVLDFGPKPLSSVAFLGSITMPSGDVGRVE